MKLLELSIRNVRGIKTLDLSLGGANCVVWGPNGAGKSAVVDAIDFLLTGRISRLIGEGTAGITLKEHGPHIDEEPEDAVVSAVVEIPGIAEAVRVERRMSAPKELVYPEGAEAALQPVLDLAARGQHVLSRREILRYITAEAGKRSEEIHALLNLSTVESIRKAFGRLKHDAEREEQAKESAVNTELERVRNTVELPKFEAGKVLERTNVLRKVLSGGALEGLKAGEIKSGLTEPSVGTGGKAKWNPGLAKKDLSSVVETMDVAVESMRKPDDELRRLLHEVREDELARRELQRIKLLELGLELLDESGSCPLCDKPWPRGELRKHLEEHILSAKAIGTKRDRLAELATAMSTTVMTLRGYVENIRLIATELRLEREEGALATWVNNLDTLANDLRNPMETYPRELFDEEAVGCLMAPSDAIPLAQKVVSELERRVPPVSQEITAWDTLTRLEQTWGQYEVARATHDRAVTTRQAAAVIYDTFEAARDGVLLSLYTQVEGRFSELYRSIHAEDESTFETSLRPAGAGLQMEVDFYGRGKHPPHALHSEGHQDTMGLCLYLALAERLTEGVINLTILDDVIMSVDSGHRRHVCLLLGQQFPDRQFLITTHDKTWKRELEVANVVPGGNVIEFTRWTIDAGPIVGVGTEFWSEIEGCLEKEDVHSAAQKLRLGLEHFFDVVCDRLQAKVRYRADQRWTLGDFLPNALSRYKKLLARAISSASSWGNSELLERLKEQDSIRAQVFAQSQAEQWAINPNVHYDRWMEFSANDFRPVVEAMRSLYSLFKCTNCGSVLFVTGLGIEPDTLRCNCSKVTLNLVSKSKS